MIQVAYAASRFDTFLANLNREIINPLILLLFALAVVVFLFGMLQFFMNAENDEKKTAGKQHMLWGVVGITIMMGVFFILNLVISTLDLDKNGNNIDPENPTAPGGVKLKDYTPPPFPPQ